MTNIEMGAVATWLRHPAALVAGAVVGLILLLWLAGRVRKVAKSERPDDTLATVAMVIGLGWSSEAVWEITTAAGFPLGVKLLLFFVLETFLTVSMARAKHHMREYGWPGRPGQTAWGIAAAMGFVALAMSGSLAEAALRLTIPLVLVKMWWDGLVGGKRRPATQVSSWKWTPRRLLLWLGAIEPGEQDVAQVHREALIGRMTNLFFALDQGSERRQKKRAARLARLSLDADKEIIDRVRERVERASWFRQPAGTSVVGPAGSALASVMVAPYLLDAPMIVAAPPAPEPPHETPSPDVPAVQRVREDLRTTQQVDEVVRAMRASFPACTQKEIAVLAHTSPSNVSRILNAKRNATRAPESAAA